MVPSVVGMNYKEAEKKIKSRDLLINCLEGKAKWQSLCCAGTKCKTGNQKAQKNMYQTYSMQKITPKPTTKPTKKPKNMMV